MRGPSFVVGALGSATLAACAASAPDPGPDTTSSTATAIVAVERTVGPGDAVRGDAVVARFVRVRQGAVDDAALRVAGVAEDVPAPGTCAEPSSGASTTSMQGRGVELLDVGQVTVASAASELASDARRSAVLLPRAMPDPAGVVSGVFYSSRSTDVFVAGAKVSLKSSGGADLDGFSLAVTAPRELGEVRVVTAAAGFDLSWESAEGDTVYADVLAPAPRTVLRCTAATDGNRLFLPYAGAEDGQVVVHRLHREAFKAKGIEPGEVRFDLARIVAFRRP